MPVKKAAPPFTLLGTWKIKSTDRGLSYAFPEIIEFKEKNSYAVAGKEGAYHPILDGGWYNYNSGSKELTISTANDAKKNYALREEGDTLQLLENGKLLVEYVKGK